MQTSGLKELALTAEIQAALHPASFAVGAATGAAHVAGAGAGAAQVGAFSETQVAGAGAGPHQTPLWASDADTRAFTLRTPSAVEPTTAERAKKAVVKLMLVSHSKPDLDDCT